MHRIKGDSSSEVKEMQLARSNNQRSQIGLPGQNKENVNDGKQINRRSYIVIKDLSYLIS